jgi:hypothetical protein
MSHEMSQVRTRSVDGFELKSRICGGEPERCRPVLSRSLICSHDMTTKLSKR